MQSRNYRGRNRWVRGLGLALLPILAFTVAGCGKSYSYKYKITVTIRDQGEVRSASSIVLVEEASSLNRNPVRPKLYGEAMPIPLKNGMIAFALLNGLARDPVAGQYQWRTSPTWVLLNRFGLTTKWNNGDDSGLLSLATMKERIKLQDYEMPEFVVFKDTRNPETIARIDPNHPELTLGAGVHFESVFLEVTDEDVTRGHVKSLLPWLSERRDYLDGSSLGEAVRGYQSIQFSNSSWF